MTPTFAEWLRERIYRSGKSIAEFCRDASPPLVEHTIRCILSGDREPRRGTILFIEQAAQPGGKES